MAKLKTTAKKQPDIQKECDKILALMKKNQDFLCKKVNQPLLAYIMLRWQNLFYAGRIVFDQCHNNPKYEFEDMGKNEKNENIIYDAWGVGVGMEALLPPEFLKKNSINRSRVDQFNESDFDELSKYFSQDDEFTKLQYKKNKTMDDWYALLGNPKYRYHSIYESKHAINDHLLCTNGNGYDWNKDGYLCDSGSSDEGRDSFGKFPLLKGNTKGEGKKIEDALNKILFQPDVQKCLNDAKEKSNKERLEYRKRELLDSLSFHVGSSVMNKVFGYETVGIMEEHQLLVDFVEEKFNKQEGSKEIETLAKRYQELWDGVKSKMPKKLSIDARTAWEKENTPAEMTEIHKKLSDFYKPFRKIVEDKFKKSKFTAEQLIEIDVFQKEATNKLLNSPEAKKMFGNRKKNREREKGHYYPMSPNFCAMDKMPKNAHESYLKASIEVCLDIIQNAKPKKDSRDDDKERVKDNILFAKNFLVKHGYNEYKKDLPKVADKYEIFKETKKYFAPVLKLYSQAKNHNVYEQEMNSSNLYLNDTKKNTYADNNIYCNIKLSPESTPKGLSNNIEFLKGLPIYEPLKSFLEKVKTIQDLRAVFFYYENIDSHNKFASIHIEIKFNGKQYHFDDEIKCEEDFVRQGFLLSHNTMALELDDYNLVTSKSKTLGSKHPHNTDGKQYFSTAQYFAVYDKNWNKIDDSYHIDERGFNIFYGGGKSEVTKWLTEQHTAMKASNPDYGTYDSQSRNNAKEGKKKLYAHDFMLWLKEHQLVKA